MAKTWQIILATVAIFFAGLVTGGATAIGVVKWVTHRRMMNGGPQGPFGRAGQVQQMSPQLMRNFAMQLDLTHEQRMKVGGIMRRAANTMRDEISDILTPEQKVKFDEMIAMQKARLQLFRQNQLQMQGQGFQQQGQAPAPAPSASQP
jgi:Spy/CpxP family protein refolding chaperone